jgi:hypothetical protein
MAEDQIVLIKTAKVPTTDLKWYDNRADIATVLSDVITYAENTPGVPNKANFIAALKVARKWVKKTGNDKLGTLVGKAITSTVLFDKYFKPIQGKAVKAMCLKGQKSYNALRSKVYKDKATAFNARTKDFKYVGIEDILDAVIANAQASSLPNKAKFIRAIKKAKAWVKKTGTPALQKRVGKAVTSAVLFNVHYKPTQIRVLMKKCGFKTAFVPSIDKVTNKGQAHNPATVIQGQEAKIVIKGKHFPKEANIAISILIGKDSDKTITVSKIKRVDAKTIELTVKAAANATTDKARTVEVFHKKYPKLLLAQKADAIKVSAPTCSQTLSVSPSSLNKGETKEVTVTINCGKLPANPALVVAPAGVTVSNVKKISDTKLTFTASVPSDATPGTKTIKVMDGNKVLAQGSFNITDGDTGTNGQLTGAKRVEALFNNFNLTNGFDADGRPKIGLSAEFGVQAYPMLSIDGNNVTERTGRSLATPRISNYRVDARLGDNYHPVPILGLKNSIAGSTIGNDTVGFELAGHLKASVLGLGSEYSFFTSIGINPRLNFMSHKLFVGAYGSFTASGNRYEYPVRGLENNTSYGVSAGGEVGYRHKSFQLRLFGEYSAQNNNYIDPSLGLNFNGQEQAVRVGGNLKLTLDKWPLISLFGIGTVSGKREIPGSAGIYSKNTVGSLELALALYFKNVSHRPFANLGYQRVYLEQADRASHQINVGGGIDSEKIGRIYAGFVWGNNLSIMQNEGNSFTGILNYSLPTIKKARWTRGFYIRAEGGSVAGQPYGGASIGYDFLRGLLQ